MSAEIRALDPGERQACLDLWQTVWPGDNADYFARYFYGDVEWLPYYTQVAVVAGKLVSAVQICKRTVACGEFQLTMGGIANVVTLPDYRGKGYNTACLQAAIGVMEADAMDFSLLFTGINDYYAREGFATWPRESLEGAIRADFAPRPTTYQVRRATADDLPAIHAIYDEYNRERPIAVQRSEAYWRDWLGMTPDRIPEWLVVAVAPSETVRGYINCGTFRSAIPYSPDAIGVRITEFGSTGGEDQEAVAAALLDTITALFVEQGARKLRLDISLEPTVLSALEPILESAERPSVNSGMVRLLHRDNLLKSVAMGLNDRWIAAGRPAGTLPFATPYGLARLDATGDFLRVAPTGEAGEILPQETLFGLLFGSLAPEQATADTTLHPLLSALFPSRAPVYWGADGF